MTYRNEIVIPHVLLKGILTIPHESAAIIVFVHGSGSNRFSIRNEYLSKLFNDQGFATLLVDLLTDEEKEKDLETNHLRFDIEFLTKRLTLITEWLTVNQSTANLKMGYFSSSTGTAAALNASTTCKVEALVSRSGRVDLVDPEVLHKITTPTLLIVGGKEESIVNVNVNYKKLDNLSIKKLVVIPHASHFFEEKGKIDEISDLSIQWYKIYLLGYNNKFIHNYRQNIFSNLTRILRWNIHVRFQNRSSVGYIMANILNSYKNKQDVTILAIPRGGVIVADVVARELSIERFGVVLSKRLRNPANSENAIGTILQDGTIYLNSASENVSKEYLQLELSKQKKELNDQVIRYGLHNNISYLQDKIANNTVILIDDGSDTGSTILSNSRWIKNQNPQRLIVSIPIIPKKILKTLSEEVDKVEFIYGPKDFRSVDYYYKDFNQVDDEKILDILKERIGDELQN